MKNQIKKGGEKYMSKKEKVQCRFCKGKECTEEDMCSLLALNTYRKEVKAGIKQMDVEEQVDYWYKAIPIVEHILAARSK